MKICILVQIVCFFSVKMWKLILSVCTFIILSNVLAYSDIGDKNTSTVFMKCCPQNQNLVKQIENYNVSARYECVDNEDLINGYEISSDPLYISEGIEVVEGFPLYCDELQMTPVDKAHANLFISTDYCYDRLVAELFNGTIQQKVSKSVALHCNVSEDSNTFNSSMHLHNIRKCCPRGQTYDLEFHQCRNTSRKNDDIFKWGLNLNDNNIYMLEYGLLCKFGEYAVELHEKFFDLSIKGSALTALRKDGIKGGRAMSGEWCIERDYNENGLLVQVCTKDCEKFGGFCVGKCCPPGSHYKLRRCGTYISYCVPNNDDDVLFNMSTYLNPLRGYHNLLDTIGVRVGIDCPEGKYALNTSIPQDEHQFTKLGQLKTPYSVTNNYCIDVFDRRECPNNDVIITAVRCFQKPLQVKDFRISFIVITISSVCLALTLIVYCAIPELKNLHGRNLICHVTMMLLACSCLARSQYSVITNETVCTLLGYGIYFGFVAAFAWLNVMCFDIWWTFGSVRTVKPLRKSGSEKKRFFWYSLYAWSITIALTLTMFLLDRYPISVILDANIGRGACWFGTLQNTEFDWPHYIFFVVPMGLVTCTNFVLWLLTARHCAQVKSEVHRLQAGSVGDRAKRRFRIDRAKYILTGKLWIVMGAGWVSELLSTLVSQPLWLWNIVDLFNELQGVFIFLILVVKPKLYYLIKKRLGLEKPEARKNATSSSGRTSSTFLSRTISSDERTQLRTSIPNSNKIS